MPQKTLYSGLVKAIIFLIPNIITLGQADSNASEFPKAVDLGNGLYDFGGVLINRRDTSLSFDVICNQTSGLVEYALVHENGKLHESLFRTSISPRWIHACLLLLKAKPLASMFTSEKNAKDLQSSNLSNHKVLANVSWEKNGEVVSRAISSMVYNQLSDRTLDTRPFVFTGSRTIDGNYLAGSEGSILAVYHDINAVINCLDPDSNSDDSWVAFHESMPPLDYKVRFHLQVLAQLSN